MAGETFDQPGRAPEAPVDVAALNAWIEAQLGRTLTLVALARDDAGVAALDAWRREAEIFPRVRLTVELAALPAEGVARAAQGAPDALLVCDVGDGDEARHWRAALLDAAEGRNLFERTFIALCGEGVTRASARKLSFEDGFATDQPFAQALAVIVRETLTRETYRRYGSSPPCYL